MRISSYNINDVGYHYVGARVLAGLASEGASRKEQLRAISRNAFKYVSDKALRLMLPEPKGTFDTIGEKICQELVQMRFAKLDRGGSYELTDSGRGIVDLLNERRFGELRRVMVSAHLGTYDNLRLVFERHLDMGTVWRPLLDASSPLTEPALKTILVRLFDGGAPIALAELEGQLVGLAAKKAEDLIVGSLLTHCFPNEPMGVTLFRVLCDRLNSLRVLNIMRASSNHFEFLKSYPVAVRSDPPEEWYTEVVVDARSGDKYRYFISDPSMDSKLIQQRLLSCIEDAFETVRPEAGYYDLPDVRDFVCERLRVAESAFDDGLNYILAWIPSPLTVAFQYERISARRKPLVRSGESTQLYNLLRNSQ